MLVSISNIFCNSCGKPLLQFIGLPSGKQRFENRGTVLKFTAPSKDVRHLTVKCQYCGEMTVEILEKVGRLAGAGKGQPEVESRQLMRSPVG